MQSNNMMCRVAAVLVAALPLVIKADLPVHCLRHQVVGQWEFTLGPAGPKRSSCGHKHPDDPNAQPAMSFLEQQGSTSTVKVTLKEPATAVAEDGTTGMWTMIYDEGFEVAVGDQTFFAFSNFEFVQDPKLGRTNVSHCGQTQIGWYHNTDRSGWGCYVGKMVDQAADASEDAALAVAASAPPAKALKRAGLFSLNNDLSAYLGPDEADTPTTNDEAPAAPKTDFLSPSDVISNADAVLAQADSKVNQAEIKPFVPSSAGFDQPMVDQWQHSVAEALNFLQLGWTATAYTDKFSGKSPRELNRFAGVPRPMPRKQKSAEAASFSSLMSLGSHVRRTLMGSDTFDWRNKDGTNWLEPVVTQGDCGSCYTISTVHMLTARNKIKKGSTSEPSFSVTFPLFCSEYNQGCDGGYGFLQSKWSEDVGLVPESCSPFAQEGSCHALKSCDLGATRYRAVNHHYVGGFYGGADAEQIQRELVQSGPVVMSFEPKEDFMYYKAGVYQSPPQKIHQEWEQVDHAVLLIGYGKDEGKDYWTMQNSWGDDWGEQGYFRMAKGTDESGCESIVVAAEVAQESSNAVLDDFIATLGQ